LEIARSFTRLVWHISLGTVRLWVRLLLNLIARRKENPEKLIGQTLTELFEVLGPTYVKLGQLLSTRRDLFSEPMIQCLEQLQDQLSPIPFHVLPDLFYQEFGLKLEEVFSQFDTSPVASASIATVYRARLRNERIVAVKVRRPGIARRMQSDLHMLRLGARFLEHLPPFRQVPLERAINEFRVCIIQQIDFRLEAAANRRLRAILACEPGIIIPELVEEYCSSSILTMDFLDGLHLSRQLESSIAHKALLTALRALYRMIFIEGFVHCDMHQGNLHMLPDGFAALIDFGFMAELKNNDRVKFAEFFYAMATNDGARCADITFETAFYSPPDLKYEKFEADIVRLVNEVSGKRANEFLVAKFVIGLFDIMRRYQIAGTTSFTMAIISLLVFEGTAKDLYPDLDFQHEARPFIMRTLSVHNEAV
jgi:ubiquinone biosynthesis protein